MTDFTPRDQDARDRIAGSLRETLFVEAGAGTGKTTSLVSRVMTLVETGSATLDRIAAITFTEAAASELRERVRDELEKAAADESRTDERRERCRRGVEDIDQSYIGTLHRFASSLLSERPLEAGLPPTFEVMDAISADLDFEDVWREWIESALDGALDISTLPLALALGLTPANMRQIADHFYDSYDLLADAPLDDVHAPEPLAVPELVQSAPELERLCRLSHIQDGDPLYSHVQRLLAAIPRLSRMEPGSPLAYRQLLRMTPIRQMRGRQGDWNIDPQSGVNACKLLKDLLAYLDENARVEIEEVRRHALMPILRALKYLVLEYARECRQSGRAGFHDLLVWARDLLRDDGEARDHFRASISHLLIDEAQDTDPIQAEIAMFLAAPDGDAPRNWRDIVPETGKLFVVGDRKQSIYRFRRADVRQVTALSEAMNGMTLDLVQNFRSQKPIIDWVNHVFDRWMSEGSRQQAEYRHLTHRWEAKTRHPASPGVWRLGDAMDERSVAPVRAAESRGIAALAREVVGCGWQVLDVDATESADDGKECYRPARYSDICILMPRRTALRQLEIDLEDADVPYRLDGSSLVFETQEVRDLLSCLRAIDDPADQVALVAALRSPAFACSDVELLDFRHAGGRFDYLDEREPPPGRVSEALADLRERHRLRTWVSIPFLIDSLVRDRRLVEAALDHPRTREAWRRYRFIIESARAFVEADGNSLRSFLEWVDRQIQKSARITETPVPEGDEDAVRVMTVHGAKGLEFPIVILTGLNSSRRDSPDSVLFDRDTGAVQVRAGSSRSGYFSTSGYEELREMESEMMEDESVRLLYVATTRARDHLVLSMYHKTKDKSAAAKIAELMEDCEDDLWRDAPVESVSALAPITSSASELPEHSADEHSTQARQEWLTKRERAIETMGRPTSVSATALAKVAKEEPDEESEEPWRRGRGGAPIGRAVHSVLQTIDLATGAGIDETARAQAVAEGIPRRREEVALLARTAIDSEVVRRAVASRRLWREAPMATPVGGGAMQGYIDLLFEEDGDLVVVDYKTDAIDSSQTEDAASRYRLQAGAYALMVSRATGKRVKEVVFLFLRPKSEQRLTDVESLAREAERVAESHFQITDG